MLTKIEYSLLYLLEHANIDGITCWPDKIDGVVGVENGEDEGVLGGVTHTWMSMILLGCGPSYKVT